MADELHPWTTSKASQTTSLGGAALGIFVSLLGDWPAFWIGLGIMLLAAYAIVSIHRSEMAKAIKARSWNAHLTLPAVAMAVMAVMTAYAYHRVSHPKPDELSQVLGAIHANRQPSPIEGELLYANYPAKNVSCDNKNGVALGTSMFEASQFPLNIIVIDGRPLLQVDWVRGMLTIRQLYILDKDDSVIASVHDNAFWIGPGYRVLQNSPADLTIFDHNEELILRVVMINNHFISAEGRFQFHGKAVIVTPRRVLVGKLDLEKDCIPDAAVSISPTAYGLQRIPVP